MKPRLFLGFDTSNYTTSVSAVDEDGKVLLNAKKILAVRDGERGLRQNDAVFQHIKNLPDSAVSLEAVLDEYGRDTISAIGVSSVPRNAEDSYMPCFLAGVAAAEMVGAALGAPVFRFSHQAGHVMAALHSAGADTLPESRFVAFHVSGGTTDVLLIEPSEEHIFSVKRIGGTRDINAGQLIDRIGVLMGLHFPAGAEMERLASMNSAVFPSFRVTVDSLECNLSGAENRAALLWNQENNPALVSAFVLDIVGRTLRSLRDGVRTQYSDIPILYAGGVMSCRQIKSLLKDDHSFFSEPAFSSDNAAGAALLARYTIAKRGE